MCILNKCCERYTDKYLSSLRKYPLSDQDDPGQDDPGQDGPSTLNIVSEDNVC